MCDMVGITYWHDYYIDGSKVAYEIRSVATNYKIYVHGDRKINHWQVLYGQINKDIFSLMINVLIISSLMFWCYSNYNEIVP